MDFSYRYERPRSQYFQVERFPRDPRDSVLGQDPNIDCGLVPKGAPRLPFTVWGAHTNGAQLTSDVVVSLSKLLGEVGGQRKRQIHILMASPKTIILYGAHVWAGAMKLRNTKRS